LRTMLSNTLQKHKLLRVDDSTNEMSPLLRHLYYNSDASIKSNNIQSMYDQLGILYMRIMEDTIGEIEDEDPFLTFLNPITKTPEDAAATLIALALHNDALNGSNMNSTSLVYRLFQIDSCTNSAIECLNIYYKKLLELYKNAIVNKNEAMSESENETPAVGTTKNTSTPEKGITVINPRKTNGTIISDSDNDTNKSSIKLMSSLPFRSPSGSPSASPPASPSVYSSSPLSPFVSSSAPASPSSSASISAPSSAVKPMSRSTSQTEEMQLSQPTSQAPRLNFSDNSSHPMNLSSTAPNGKKGGKKFLQKTRKRNRKLKQALTRYQKKKKTFVKKSPKNRSKKSKPLRYKNKYIK